MIADFQTYNMRGTLNFLPSVLNVLAINSLSQRFHYQLINNKRSSGCLFGGGGKSNTTSTNRGGNKVQNPHWDPRFKANTILAGKIKNMKMTKIIEKAYYSPVFLLAKKVVRDASRIMQKVLVCPNAIMLMITSLYLKQQTLKCLRISDVCR